MNNELKPCPFCGKNADHSNSYGAGMVSCSSGCSLGVLAENDAFGEIAIEKWNTRVYEKELSELREQLALAVTYLKEGKRKFAPNTTNSDVDLFIEKHDKENK